MNNKIFYLSYILHFFDNEYVIYHSLAETYCSKSILGVDTDPYFKSQGNCFQLIYSTNHCLIRFSKNCNSNDLLEKDWLKQYVQDNYNKIFNNQNCDSTKYILEEYFEFCKQKTFYAREIKIKMKYNMFEKIINNPYFNKKEYTTEDIFYICYSYCFSFLDNKISVLENILYLIIGENFNLNSINQKFLEYTSEKNQNSKYYKKFIEQISENRTIDLQFEIEQFICKYYCYISSDNFLNELFHWKTKVTNLFSLIQQTFCFHILTDDNDLIVKIYHDVCSDFTFDVLIQDVNAVMFLFSETCKLKFVSFSGTLKCFLQEIFDPKNNINIFIELDEFYISLYEYEKNKFIIESARFHDFLFFVYKKNKKSILIHINKVQIIIQYNQIKESFEIEKKEKTDLFEMNKFLLVNKKLMIFEDKSLQNLLIEIAKIIIDDFIYQEGIEIIDISISDHEHKTQQIRKNDNIFNYEISKTVSDPHINQINDQYNSIQRFSTSGSYNAGSQLIGLKGLNQRYFNFGFISGLFDNKFTFFKLCSEFDQNKPTKIHNFISYMADLFRVSDENYSSTHDEKQYFDTFNFQHFHKDYIFFHLHTANSKPIYHEKLSFPDNFVKSKSNHIICCDETNLTTILKNDMIDHILTLYHHISFNIHDRHKDEFSISADSNDIYYQILIKKSNFNILFLRIMILESINQDISTIQRTRTEFEFIFDAVNCKITLLTNSFHGYTNHFRFNKCKFHQELHLFSNISFNDAYQLTFINAELKKPIYIKKFIKLQVDKRKNFLSISNWYPYSAMIIHDFDIEILNKIPEKYAKIRIENCHFISVVNNVFFKDHFLLPLDINQANLSDIYHRILPQFLRTSIITILDISKSILTPNLKIIGIYNFITVKECISPFSIDSFFLNLKIYNHNDEFNINNIITKATPKKTINLFEYNSGEIIIKNLKIKRFENIFINSIQIINCTIEIFHNVKCKNIEIINTECSFTLSIKDQKVEYTNNSLDLKRNENEYMMLGNNYTSTVFQ